MESSMVFKSVRSLEIHFDLRTDCDKVMRVHTRLETFNLDRKLQWDLEHWNAGANGNEDCIIQFSSTSCVFNSPRRDFH